FQLQASLAILNQMDTIITTGTSSGKTLCHLIPMLLLPNTLSMMISPVKELQVTQVQHLLNISCKNNVINEDTSNDQSLWKSIQKGHYQYLIISPEQLEMHNSHFP
ncbi:hypothetical protein HD554DRAFT_1989885, partial [Boletus coccyginus]